MNVDSVVEETATEAAAEADRVAADEAAKVAAAEADKLAADEAAKAAQGEIAKDSAEEASGEPSDRTDGKSTAGVLGAMPVTEPPAAREEVAEDQPSTSAVPPSSRYCRRSGNRGTQTCLPAAQGVAPSPARDGPSSATTFKSLARGQASRGR